MSDWPPDSGSRVVTSAPTTATAGGTANTKGSYAVLAVATTSFSPLLVLIFTFNTEAAYLVDVAVGAAGSEVIILADIHYSGRSDVPIFVGLPLGIPTGSRITYRVASSTASATVSAVVQILNAGTDFTVHRNVFTTYGQDSSTSLGTAVTPSSTVGVKGVYSQITAATTRVHKGLLACFGNQNNLAAAVASWSVDIAVGAAGSETVLVSNFRIGSSAADTLLPSPSPIYPVSIPEGSRLSVRASCTINTAVQFVFGVVLYGIT